jgi:hypothetical protein
MGIRSTPVSGERVLVADEPGKVEDAGRNLPQHDEPGVALDLPQVDQEKVGVSAAVGNHETVFRERAGQVACILNDAALQSGEGRLLC